MVPNCSPVYGASSGTQHVLPRSNFEVDLSVSLFTMLFVMTSGNLNIDLTKTIVYKYCRCVGVMVREPAPLLATVCAPGPVCAGLRSAGAGGARQLAPDSSRTVS